MRSPRRRSLVIALPLATAAFSPERSRPRSGPAGTAWAPAVTTSHGVPTPRPTTITTAQCRRWWDSSSSRSQGHAG